jgi:hypothetical protein
MAKSRGIWMTSSLPKPGRGPIARRALGAAGILLIASGLQSCSSEGNADWSQMYSVVKDAWSKDSDGVSLAEAASVPYASLGIREGSGPERLLVLATDTNGERIWTSAAGVAITTRGGRVVRTAGFAHDLGGLGTGAVGGDAHSGDVTAVRHKLQWWADFPDLGLYQVSISCEDVPAGTEVITILGKDLRTIRVDENCHSEQLDWTFQNSFWINPATGFVWSSIQEIHPKLAPIAIEILRPPETP